MVSTFVGGGGGGGGFLPVARNIGVWSTLALSPFNRLNLRVDRVADLGKCIAWAQNS